MQPLAKFEGLDIPFNWMDEDIWFPADNPAHILGLGNVAQLMRRLEPDEKRIISNDTSTGAKDKWHVNLPGLSRMIIASRKPIAKPFQRWVFHELIPNAFRERQSRAVLIENFISPIALPRGRQFTNKLFQEFSRVYGWRVPEDDENEHNPAMRGLIDAFVYGMLPQSVKEEMERLNPLIGGRRKLRLWQVLKLEIVGEVVRARIEQLLTIMARVPDGDKKNFRQELALHDLTRKIPVSMKVQKDIRMVIELPCRGQQLALFNIR